MNHDASETRATALSPRRGPAGGAWLAAVTLVWCLGLLAPKEAQATHQIFQDLWYRVEIDGQPAGYMHLESGDEGGPPSASTHYTSTQVHMSFTRDGQAQEIEIFSRFYENGERKPGLIIAEQKLGPTPIETRYSIEGGKIVVLSGGEKSERPMPEGQWMTPMAAQEEVEKNVARILAGVASGDDVERSFEVQSLDPTVGLAPVISRWTLEAPRVDLDLDGKTVAVSRWSQSQSYAPGLISQVDLDENATMVRTESHAMGLRMTTTLSTRDAVLASGDGPELLVQSFIYPDRPLIAPRELRRAIYRLSVEGSEEPAVLPSVGYQTMLPDGRVVVDLDAPHGSAEMAVTETAVTETVVTEAARQKLLASSVYMNADDPGVRALHHRAVTALDPKASPAERAEALRRAVGRHLSEKNLDSVLATASQAASSRSGDCTEHAVLLAALLRADGIPARVATGLIYVESFAGERDLFAYHMWTQALLDDRFVDLDATLDGVAFDAAHVTLDVPDLDEEGAALRHMAAMAPLIGRTRIEVLEAGSGATDR